MDPLNPQDRDHLRILSIMHYLFAAFGVLGLAFVALHAMMMREVMNPEFVKNTPNPPPDGFLDMFVWMYVIIVVILIIGMVLNLMAARWLQLRRHRTFCIAVAAIDTLQIPIGTLLGVFTILVLSRDSVRQAFDRNHDSPPITAA